MIGPVLGCRCQALRAEIAAGTVIGPGESLSQVGSAVPCKNGLGELG